MPSNLVAARIVGGLFVTGTLAGALSLVPLRPLLGAEDTVRAVADDPDRAVLGAVLILVMGLALAFVPLVLHPTLRAHTEVLALGYVVFRSGLETAAYLASALAWLLLAGIGREYVDAAEPARLEAIGAVVRQGYDLVAHAALPIVFALGALLLNLALLRARLVPRWLSGWGVLAALLCLAAGVLTMLGAVAGGSAVPVALQGPIALQELTLAGWLIVQGFAQPVRAPSSPTTEGRPVMPLLPIGPLAIVLRRTNASRTQVGIVAAVVLGLLVLGVGLLLR